MLRESFILSVQSAVDAKVEVEGVETSLLRPSLAMRNVAIANRLVPGTNLLEFEKLEINLDGGQLLKRKFIVDSGNVSGLEWGGLRADSGLLNSNDEVGGSGTVFPFDEIGQKSQQAVTQTLNQLFELAKAELDPNQLESVQLAGQLRQEWDDRFKDIEQRVHALRARVDQLSKLGESKSGNPLQKIQDFRKIAEEARLVLQEIQDVRNELASLPNLADENFQQLNHAKDRDIERLQNKLARLSLDPEMVTEMLIGPAVKGKLQTALDWFQIAKTQLAHHRIQKPQRMRGVDISFLQTSQLPDFLVRKLKLSGSAEIAGIRTPFSGTMSNLTSEPEKYDRPVVLQLQCRGAVPARLMVSLDQFEQKSKIEVMLNFNLPPTDFAPLGEEADLDLVVSAESTVVEAHLQIVENELTGDITFQQRPVAITANIEQGESDRINRMLSELFSTIDRVDVAVNLSGTVDQPKWKIESNIGPMLAAGMNNIVAQEVEALAQGRANEIENLMSQQAQELEELLNTRYGAVLAELKFNELAAGKLLQPLAKNPLRFKNLLRR